MLRALSLVALLLALGVALLLFVGKSRRDLDTLRGQHLEVPGEAAPLELSWPEAGRALERLEALLAQPTPAAQELQALAQKAASWAAGSQPGSPAYGLAVALRAACWELSQASPDLEDPHRQRAKAELARARRLWTGQSPGSVTQGLQDQVKNLQIQRSEELSQSLQEAP
jgi:hypothetical protein